MDHALTWGEAKQLYTWGSVKGDTSTTGQTQTANLELYKPGLNSTVDIATLNSNFDTLDTAIAGILTWKNGIVAPMDYKGSVADMTALNAITAKKAGDVYNITSTGENYAWDGNAWDSFGTSVDLSGYATTASPALTGTPTAPTAASGTDTTQIATTAFVQDAIEDAFGVVLNASY